MSKKSSKHIEFNLANSAVTYETGDHLGVLAKNDEMTVEKFSRILKVDPDSTFSFPKAPKTPTTPNLPDPCSVKTVLESYCDLNAIVKRPLLEMCANFATDLTEKERLMEMSSSSDKGKV